MLKVGVSYEKSVLSSVIIVWFLINILKHLKKIFLALLLVSVSVSVSSQVKKGDFMLGGNLAFGRQKAQLPATASTGIDGQTTLRFAPRIGVFFTPRLLVGFGTNVNYTGTSDTYTLQDSVGNSYRMKNQYYELELGMGLFTSYYLPLSDRLYWVNTVSVNWGSLIRGDKLSTLFSDDRPRQDRDRYVDGKISTGLQYFVLPHLSVSAGYQPFSITYNYQKTIRPNTPLSSRDRVIIDFSSVAKGFFIGVNYLIISDDTKNEN